MHETLIKRAAIAVVPDLLHCIKATTYIHSSIVMYRQERKALTLHERLGEASRGALTGLLLTPVTKYCDVDLTQRFVKILYRPFERSMQGPLDPQGFWLHNYTLTVKRSVWRTGSKQKHLHAASRELSARTNG